MKRKIINKVAQFWQYEQDGIKAKNLEQEAEKKNINEIIKKQG